MGRSIINNSPRQTPALGGAGRGLKPATDRAWVLSEEHGNFCYIVTEALDRQNRKRFSRRRNPG
jgi:hypothetical protein